MDRLPHSSRAPTGQAHYPSVEALIGGPETAKAIARASNVANALGLVGLVVIAAAFIVVVFVVGR